MERTNPCPANATTPSNPTSTDTPSLPTVPDLTVTANNTNRVQGTLNPAFTGVLVGVLNNDNLTALFTTTATLASSPGTYPIFPEIQDPDLRLGNYTVTTNLGTLTILPLPTVALTPNGSNNLLTLSWPDIPAGFLLEETPSLTPANWQVITDGISSGGGQNTYVVTNDLNTPSRLFRLRLP